MATGDVDPIALDDAALAAFLRGTAASSPRGKELLLEAAHRLEAGKEAFAALAFERDNLKLELAEALRLLAEVSLPRMAVVVGYASSYDEAAQFRSAPGAINHIEQQLGRQIARELLKQRLVAFSLVRSAERREFVINASVVIFRPQDGGFDAVAEELRTWPA